MPGDPSTRINGLTDPYFGNRAATRVHDYGHTFRWVRGDRYIAVQRGTCVDNRRSLIIRDTLAGQDVLDGHQPLVDVIPVGGADWNDPVALPQIAEGWAVRRNPARGAFVAG